VKHIPGPRAWKASWRVFFALLPEPRARQRLHGLGSALAADQPSRLAAASNLHLTLLRKARSAPDPAWAVIDPPIAMPVRRLALMRSISEPGGVRYRPLALWPLTGARPRIAVKRSA
jgi:2'-5' RNA ligase